MKETHICCGRNKPQSSGFSGAVASYFLGDHLKCRSKASICENGKWYCKRHAPSKIRERDEKKYWNSVKHIVRDEKKATQ